MPVGFTNYLLPNICLNNFVPFYYAISLVISNYYVGITFT